MATGQASHPNPGYCEDCGPGCLHCSDPATGWFVDGPILAFDLASDKWVCAAHFDYEAAEARRA